MDPKNRGGKRARRTHSVAGVAWWVWLRVFLLAAGLAGDVVSGARAAEGPAEAMELRLGLHPNATRLVLEMSRETPFRILSLTDPYRIIIDFSNLTWPIAEAPRPGKGLVRLVRQGQFTADTRRMVLELERPVRVREASMLPASDGHLPRFVVDLEPAPSEEFDRSLGQVLAAWPAAAEEPRQFALRAPKGTMPAKAGPAPAGPVQVASIAPPELPSMSHPIVPTVVPSLVPPARATTVPVVAGPPAAPPSVAPVPERLAPAVLAVPPTLPKPKPMRTKQIVVLDPGHGGADPGAIGVGGVHEKDVTLAMARAMQKELLDTGRYEVVLTRDRDVFVRLRDRVAVARKANADLFVSLHADSIGTEGFRGLSVYTLSETASDREAEMLAAKENRVDAIGGVNLASENDLVASILIDLAQRDTMNQSRRFAKQLIRDLKPVVELIPRPHRSAGFAVLTAADVPSVLVELGYLSTPQEAIQLTSPAHRAKLAAGMRRSIDAYFDWLLESQGL